MKSAGGRTKSRDILAQVQDKIQSADLVAIQGGTAETITAAMLTMVNGLAVRPCQGLSAKTQRAGVPHPDVDITAAETPRAISAGEFDTLYTCAVNHVLNACWMLDDVFAGSGANDVAAGNHEAVMTLAMKIFLEAIEMGQMARQFPRAVFTVGTDASTWSVDKRFDFYASVARCGVAMTGRNVASGIHDHATIAQCRNSAKKEGSTDCWHYAKSPEYVVECLMATWAERDARCALATSSGTRCVPFELCYGLCVADAVGRRLLSADANGMKGPMTDVSPPRWSEQRKHQYPAIDWSNGYVWGFDGQAINTPVDVPWHLIPGMECRAENVALEYVEPLCYSVQPNWLTLLGAKEMQLPLASLHLSLDWTIARNLCPKTNNQLILQLDAGIMTSLAG
jgi:hypothetical protein